ncbi:uncharacterized protein LOC141602490 [Silene latifolia]|uniref:uncharacterized protein LOC141602490 n=1 Tax=Silene latifolia TaxID=37657 RepID=UPI003D77B081
MDLSSHNQSSDAADNIPVITADSNPDVIAPSAARNRNQSSAARNRNRNIRVVSGLLRRGGGFRWTDEMHHRFLEAVNSLGGLNQATPENILELMNVNNLTVETVNSHLRMHRTIIRGHMQLPYMSWAPGECRRSYISG